MYIDCESVYSSSSAIKQTSETLRKKVNLVPLVIPVDFIHSCHRRLKKNNFIQVVQKAGMPETRNAGMPEIKTRKS